MVEILKALFVKERRFRNKPKEQFNKEIKDAVEQRKKIVEELFNAGEDAFNDKRYEEAVRYYQGSIDVLPTSSAYLNLGCSLQFLARNEEAVEAYTKGLALAQARQDKNMQKAFKRNMKSLRVG